MKRMPSMKGQTPVDMSPVLMLLNDDSDDLREAYDGLKRNHKLKALVFLSSVWEIKTFRFLPNGKKRTRISGERSTSTGC